jgi:hypothetical protein
MVLQEKMIRGKQTYRDAKDMRPRAEGFQRDDAKILSMSVRASKRGASFRKSIYLLTLQYILPEPFI